MRTYSLADVDFILGSVRLTGLADDAIDIEPGEPLYVLQKGGDYKDNVRVRNDDRSRRVTLRLKQGSLSNDVLSALVIEDRLGAGVRSCQIKDRNGTSIFNAPRVWIAEEAPSGWNREGNKDRVWVLETDFSENIIGGARP